LQVFDLSFSYREVRVLEDLNFSVSEREFVLLTGANGSGKTTLLKLLAGLLPVQKGKISLDGKQLSRQDLRILCGYVFHNPINQIVGSTVEEDIAFGLENIGMPRKTMVERVQEVLDFFDLNSLKDEDPLNLSAGQAQKLAIASIVALKPKYLLLDEPTTMLDHKGCTQVKEILKKLNELDTTVILSTHEIHQFYDLAKRVIHLKNGRIDFDGSVEEFFASTIDDVEK